MRLVSLLAKEMAHRKLNLALSVTSVALGVACGVGALLMLRVFDLETERTLSAMDQRSRAAWDNFQDEMRKDMLNLGFNLMILHKEHNLSSPAEQTRYLPESYINRLAESSLATINHLLPFLQQKIWWPEKKRWVTLVGTTGEVYVKNADKQKPMQPRVAPQHAVLGFAIHQSLEIKAGDSITVMDRTFTVAECLPAKGFEEDEQIWIPLNEAQDLLGKKGLITGMLAVNCQCAPKDMIKIHRAIAALLPDTKVVEHNSRLVARAQVRSKSAVEADQALEREKETRKQLKERRLAFAAVFVPLVVVVSVVWLAFLIWSNVRQRKTEIGILSAMGLPARSILFLFIGKAVIVGLAGSLVGFGAGVALVAVQGGAVATVVRSSDIPLAAGYLLVAVLMSMVASWVPALVAARMDPAVSLREGD